MAAIVVAALDHDHVGEVGERPLALLGVVGGVERRAVGVRPPELDDAGEARLAGPAPGIAGHRDRPTRRPVVAAVRGEHLVPAGVAAGHADGVLRRLGAAVGEEDHVEVAGGELGDQAGGFAAGVVGEDRRDRAELVGLLLDRRHQLGVLVPDVEVDELAGEVEVALAVLVPEAGALATGDDDGVEQRLRRPGVEHVGPVVGEGPRTLRVDGGHGVRLFDTEQSASERGMHGLRGRETQRSWPEAIRSGGVQIPLCARTTPPTRWHSGRTANLRASTVTGHG